MDLAEQRDAPLARCSAEGKHKMCWQRDLLQQPLLRQKPVAGAAEAVALLVRSPAARAVATPNPRTVASAAVTPTAHILHAAATRPPWSIVAPSWGSGRDRRITVTTLFAKYEEPRTWIGSRMAIGLGLLGRPAMGSLCPVTAGRLRCLCPGCLSSITCGCNVRVGLCRHRHMVF